MCGNPLWRAPQPPLLAHPNLSRLCVLVSSLVECVCVHAHLCAPHLALLESLTPQLTSVPVKALCSLACCLGLTCLSPPRTPHTLPQGKSVSSRKEGKQVVKGSGPQTYILRLPPRCHQSSLSPLSRGESGGRMWALCLGTPH